MYAVRSMLECADSTDSLLACSHAVFTLDSLSVSLTRSPAARLALSLLARLSPTCCRAGPLLLTPLRCRSAYARVLIVHVLSSVPHARISGGGRCCIGAGGRPFLSRRDFVSCARCGIVVYWWETHRKLPTSHEGAWHAVSELGSRHRTEWWECRVRLLMLAPVLRRLLATVSYTAKQQCESFKLYASDGQCESPQRFATARFCHPTAR